MQSNQLETSRETLAAEMIQRNPGHFFEFPLVTTLNPQTPDGHLENSFTMLERTFSTLSEKEPILAELGEILDTARLNRSLRDDVVMTAIQKAPAEEIFRRGRDQFDRLYKEGATIPRVMAISIHPYLTGVPHRIKYLEELYDYILGHEGVVMWTGAEILDWYRA